MTYEGTAKQQWAQIGIDLAAGYITPTEMYELGKRIIAEGDADESEVIRELRREVDSLEEDNRDKDREISDLEDDVSRLEKKVKSIEDRLGVKT